MSNVTNYGWHIMKQLLNNNNTLTVNEQELPVSGSFIFQNDPGTSLNVSGGVYYR